MRITGAFGTTLESVVLFAFALAACSSDDGTGQAEAGGAPAATEVTIQDEAGAEAKASQTLEISI